MSFLFSTLPMEVEAQITKDVELRRTYLKNYKNVLENLKTIHNVCNKYNFHSNPQYREQEEGAWVEYEEYVKNRRENFYAGLTTLRYETQYISYQASPVETYLSVNEFGANEYLFGENGDKYEVDEGKYVSK